MKLMMINPYQAHNGDLLVTIKGKDVTVDGVITNIGERYIAKPHDNKQIDISSRDFVRGKVNLMVFNDDAIIFVIRSQ